MFECVNVIVCQHFNVALCECCSVTMDQCCNMLVWQCIDVLYFFVPASRMVKNYLGCLLKGSLICFWAVHYRSKYPSPTIIVI
jgi:hypothetical protein